MLRSVARAEPRADGPGRAATVSAVDAHYASIGSTIDWGNAPSWAAFGTAVIAAGFAAGAYQRERRRDRIAWQARIGAQAFKFAGWITGDREATQLYLHNASDLPIYNVNVWFWQMDWFTHTTLAEAFENFNELHGEDVVAPGETIHKALPGFDVAQEITVTFTDAQGVLWSRHKGSLQPDGAPGKKQPVWFQEIHWNRADETSNPTGILGRLLSKVRSVRTHGSST